MDTGEKLGFACSRIAAEKNVDVGACRRRCTSSEQHAQQTLLHVAETPIVIPNRMPHQIEGASDAASSS